MSIANTIETILENRKKFKGEVNEREGKLNRMKEEFSKIGNFSSDFESMKALDEETKKTISSLKGKADEIETEINSDSVQEAITKLKSRANREYINIGILAPWRHGKSTFLRKIFNVDEEVGKYLFPTSTHDNEACTATTVHYINNAIGSEANTKTACKAVVSYFTKDEIIISIKSIIEKMGEPYSKEWLSSDNAQADNAQADSLEDLVKIISESNLYKNGIESATAADTHHKALKEYIDGYEDYKDVLGEDKVGNTPFDLNKVNLNKEDEEIYEKIFQSMCFYKSPKEMEKHNSFLCLGVKKVEIHMPLCSDDGTSLGCIRFIDTPGLGEKRTSVEYNLTKVLQSDIDIVIAICKTDKNIADDFNTFNGYLRKDFNVRYKDESNKERDASGCIFYLINCVKNNDLGRKIVSVEEDCIINSLSSEGGIGGQPIHLPNGHIGYVDIKSDTSYDINDKTEKQPSDSGTRVYDIQQVKSGEKGAIKFLEKCLGSITDIRQIDECFTHDFSSKLDGIDNLYSSWKSDLSKLRLKEKESGADDLNLICEIAESVKNIHPEYIKDNSIDQIKSILDQDNCSECVVKEFIESKGAEVQSIVDNGIGDRNNFAVLYETAPCVLGDVSYSLDEEFAVYSSLKKEFKNYINERVSKCLNEEAIKDAQQNCGRSIIKAFMKKIEYFVRDILKVNNDDPARFVEAFKRFAIDENYGTCMLNRFEKLLNPISYKEKLREGLDSILGDCYHMEKIHGYNDSLLFCTGEPKYARRMFILWLLDIMDELSDVLKGEVEGKNSFGALIQEIKMAYECDVLKEWRELVSDRGELTRDIADFIKANSDVIHNLNSVNKKIREWNEFVDSVARKQVSKNGTIASVKSVGNNEAIYELDGV